MSKSQIPIKSQLSNVQNDVSSSLVIKKLVIKWSLVIGVWSFQRLALVQTSHGVAHVPAKILNK